MYSPTYQTSPPTQNHYLNYNHIPPIQQYNVGSCRLEMKQVNSYHRNQYVNYPPISQDSYMHSPQPQPQPYPSENCYSDPPPLLDPPYWAVPARGDSRLEPICGTENVHAATDLTSRRWFRVGRCPSSDIPLLHFTSSRRHALIFHHPSGACYITDCNSVHGTYIDGNRVLPYPHPPRKVRRGAMIRFGGPGAPTFILKSFAVGYQDLVRDLGGVADTCFLPYPTQQPQETSVQPNLIESSSSEEEEEHPSEQQAPPKKEAAKKSHYFRHAHHFIQHSRNRSRRLASQTQTPSDEMREGDVLACIRGDGGGVACIANEQDAPTAALVLLNTRLNAGGLPSTSRHLTTKAKERFSYLARSSTSSTSFSLSTGSRKRSFSTAMDSSTTQLPTKKVKPILVQSSSSLTPKEIEEHRQIVHCISGSLLSDDTSTKERIRKIRFSDEEEFDDKDFVTADELSTVSSDEDSVEDLPSSSP